MKRLFLIMTLFIFILCGLFNVDAKGKTGETNPFLLSEYSLNGRKHFDHCKRITFFQYKIKNQEYFMAKPKNKNNTEVPEELDKTDDVAVTEKPDQTDDTVKSEEADKTDDTTEPKEPDKTNTTTQSEKIITYNVVYAFRHNKVDYAEGKTITSKEISEKEADRLIKLKVIKKAG